MTSVRSVATLLAALAPQQRGAIDALRKAARRAAPGLAEAVRWGQLCLVDAEGKAVLALIPHGRHANVQLFDASVLVDRFPELEGTGRRARHLKCPYDSAIDPLRVEGLVRAAVQAWRARTK